jgi:hypothetical protein
MSEEVKSWPEWRHGESWHGMARKLEHGRRCKVVWFCATQNWSLLTVFIVRVDRM